MDRIFQVVTTVYAFEIFLDRQSDTICLKEINTCQHNQIICNIIKPLKSWRILCKNVVRFLCQSSNHVWFGFWVLEHKFLYSNGKPMKPGKEWQKYCGQNISKAFSWLKEMEISWKVQRKLFLEGYKARSPPWFIQCLGIEKATNHYSNNYDDRCFMTSWWVIVL